MTQKTALERLILEIRKISILPTEDYTPTIDHYVPMRYLQYYLNLAYAVGFDEGRASLSNSKPVRQLTKNGRLIKIWESQTAASKAMGVNNRTINKAVNGTIKTCKGFKWKNDEIKNPDTITVSGLQHHF